MPEVSKHRAIRVCRRPVNPSDAPHQIAMSHKKDSWSLNAVSLIKVRPSQSLVKGTGRHFFSANALCREHTKLLE